MRKAYSHVGESIGNQKMRVSSLEGISDKQAPSTEEIKREKYPIGRIP